MNETIGSAFATAFLALVHLLSGRLALAAGPPRRAWLSMSGGKGGRWILTAAVVAGWFAGRLLRIEEAAVTMLVALLAAGVILNVLKEELPEQRESRFAAFLAGAAGYGALLLAL